MVKWKTVYFEQRISTSCKITVIYAYVEDTKVLLRPLNVHFIDKKSANTFHIATVMLPPSFLHFCYIILNNVYEKV